MDSRRPVRQIPSFGSFTGGPPVPRDLWILLGVIFVTFSLQFFDTTAPVIRALRLSPTIWDRLAVWQLATYGFTGFGPPRVWFLLELVLIFWFGRNLYWKVGRKGFWGLLAWSLGTAGGVALAAHALFSLLPGWTLPTLLLIQGQHILLVIFIAAFAILNANATIYLMFVLPIQAKWFLPLEILFAFIAFLGSRDLAGFLGLLAAVGMTWSILTPGGLRGLRRRLVREPWLRFQRWRYGRHLKDLETGRGWGKGAREPGKGEDERETPPGDRAGNGKVRRGPWVH